MTVPAPMRELVAARANHRCEYCLLRDEDALGTHEADHIRPVKHHGETTADNLAYACLRCNRHKGTDIAGYDGETGRLTSLFNPRSDRWSDHFALDGGRLRPLTATGRVTVDILQLNHPERVEERMALAEVGRYPD
ncbi:MAG: HNH endonuclease [Chloroflexi bacterium]|nr:HNH endonuclease [Chloroflexota bacterium]MBI3762097.1 HNH endonuclease [Chloroflexota bacterium]